MRMSALGQKQTLVRLYMMCALRGFLLAACVVFVIATIDVALAQPFGMTRTAPPAEVGGFADWILAKQAEFYRMLSSLIRAAKADGSAAYTLLGVSFLYGVFHAAGPGHGKAVISSYLVANNETWRRGLVLSFASAMLQALVAVAIVGVAAALLGATAKAMSNTVRVIEIVSYALIVLIGLRLLWVKGRAFVRLLRDKKPARHSMIITTVITLTNTNTNTIILTTIRIPMVSSMTTKLLPGVMRMHRSRRN
jgi:nickel/cobalt transporter (NicO) family protein